MKLLVPSLLVASLGLIVARASWAHQVDEYLQAALLCVDRSGVRVMLRLSPGGAVAPALIPLIDADGDGTIDPAEASVYVERVRRALSLGADGQALAARVETSLRLASFARGPARSRSPWWRRCLLARANGRSASRIITGRSSPRTWRTSSRRPTRASRSSDRSEPRTSRPIASISSTRPPRASWRPVGALLAGVAVLAAGARWVARRRLRSVSS